MCCALASTSVKRFSRRLNSGFQYTPVDSMATCVAPCSSSQSLSTNKSAVIVPKLRTSLRGVPFELGVIMHATTSFLWISSPQTPLVQNVHTRPPHGSYVMGERMAVCAVRASREESDRLWCLETARSEY